MQLCKCGHLFNLSLCVTERFQILSDQSILLKVTDFDLIQVNFCPRCGGKNIAEVFNDWISTKQNKCQCGIFSKLLELINTCVSYSDEIKTHFIRTDTEEYIHCFYCINCGDLLSIPYDLDSLSCPLESEITEVNTKFASLKDIDNCDKIFGEPDFVQHPEMFIREDGYVPKMWQTTKKILIYSSLYDSFDLRITEYLNDEIGLMFNFITKT